MLNSIYEELKMLKVRVRGRFKAVKGGIGSVERYIKDALGILRTKYQNRS